MSTEPDEHPKFKKRIGILLFHGLTGMPSELKPLAKILKQQGFQVETPLIAGHGGSHQDLLKTSWKDWLKGAENTFEQMRQTCDEIYAGGLSMGAILAAALAVRYPDLKGLFLLSPHLGIIQDNLQASQCLLPIGYYLKPTHSLFYWTEKAPFGLKDERLQKKIEQAIHGSKAGQTSHYGLYRTYIGSIYQMLDLIDFCKKHAHQVTCPALILQSMEDTITKLENAALIYSLLGSKVKQVRMFTGCNHVMSVDLRKKDIGNWMSQFIQEQSLLLNPGASVENNFPIANNASIADFDQLHVDILADEPSKHTIIVQMGKQPVLIWPIVETSLNVLQNTHPLSFQHLGWLLGRARVFAIELPQKNKTSAIYMDSDMPIALLNEAWRRAWTALKALQKAQKVDLVLFTNHHPQTEVFRSFWLQQCFVQIPFADSSEPERQLVWALHHQNALVQNSLLILSVWLWEQTVLMPKQCKLPSRNKAWRPFLKQNLMQVSSMPAELTKRPN